MWCAVAEYDYSVRGLSWYPDNLIRFRAYGLNRGKTIKRIERKIDCWRKVQRKHREEVAAIETFRY